MTNSTSRQTDLDSLAPVTNEGASCPSIFSFREYAGASEASMPPINEIYVIKSPMHDIATITDPVQKSWLHEIISADSLSKDNVRLFWDSHGWPHYGLNLSVPVDTPISILFVPNSECWPQFSHSVHYKKPNTEFKDEFLPDMLVISPDADPSPSSSYYLPPSNLGQHNHNYYKITPDNITFNTRIPTEEGYTHILTVSKLSPIDVLDKIDFPEVLEIPLAQSRSTDITTNSNAPYAPPSDDSIVQGAFCFTKQDQVQAILPLAEDQSIIITRNLAPASDSTDVINLQPLPTPGPSSYIECLSE